MAFDEITESVQRQERPILSFPKFGGESTNVIIHGADVGSFNDSLLLSSVSVARRSYSRPTSPITSMSMSMGGSLPALPALWPPLKGQRYCKKQKRRCSKRKGLSSSMMYLYEGSINQKRLSTALSDLSPSSDESLFSSASSLQHSHHQNHFWSKQSCHEFWDKYLECDLNINSSELLSDSASVIPLKEMKKMNLNTIDDDDDEEEEREQLLSVNPLQCYTKINRSIRKLLRKTFNGAANFAELENLILNPPLPASPSSNSFEFAFGQVLTSSDSNITVKLDTPFHRVWLHAICQYHGHFSQSKSVDQDRLVHITFKKSSPADSSTSSLPPSCSLYEFLTQN